MLSYFGAIRQFWTIAPHEEPEALSAISNDERYTAAERDAVLLTHGDPGEALAATEREATTIRPWRFAGALQPPYC